jgi:hypothetical protein
MTFEQMFNMIRESFATPNGVSVTAIDEKSASLQVTYILSQATLKLLGNFVLQRQRAPVSVHQHLTSLLLRRAVMVQNNERM